LTKAAPTQPQAAAAKPQRQSPHPRTLEPHPPAIHTPAAAPPKIGCTIQPNLTKHKNNYISTNSQLSQQTKYPLEPQNSALFFVDFTFFFQAFLREKKP
jgi:hypothetical protein